ncbi:hypothetical protein SARC_08737 [Sphaeroforma arctica JP610]|uniref:Uncharacterized protein n=1 Tax=Sphaeroforma arctica JP610 TaxID=667725 RepID=A0A0L0FS85_9EUKA|nr:hypothetical protein SARC_08737 [Sphaeroforma arctica JP610]KNC78843.1 hypothetical protein SARC_08737 [Sphaeroforma arctica JP610]|eukprot:XP_014152745.1 hypothetical protein SARC_08737 [Sphaeroforma arctica JP610]
MIHVVVAGMVNAGKTSLAKAVLNIKPGDTRAVAQSLVVGYGNMAEKPTGAVRVEGDQSVVLYDLRGEDMMHGRWTQGAPEEMDIGLFVVEGSANSNNLQLYRELQRRCKQVVRMADNVCGITCSGACRVNCIADRVSILNEGSTLIVDKLRPEARDRLIGQWKEQLGVDHIYTTSIRGYDEMKEEVHFVDGVEELLQAMGLYLESNGKDILLARYQKEKGRAATNVIVKAVSKVMLGDAVHTVEQQAAERLHYIYTGSWDIRVLPPEIHPVVGLSSRLVSLLPVVGKVSDQLVGASTMCLQLLALAHGLRKFDGAPETPTEDAQSAANTFATTVNYDTVRSLFENVTAKVYDHGGAVYEAGEEYFFDNIGSLLANGITKPRQRRN